MFYQLLLFSSIFVAYQPLLFGFTIYPTNGKCQTLDETARPPWKKEQQSLRKCSELSQARTVELPQPELPAEYLLIYSDPTDQALSEVDTENGIDAQYLLKTIYKKRREISQEPMEIYRGNEIVEQLSLGIPPSIEIQNDEDLIEAVESPVSSIGYDLKEGSVHEPLKKNRIEQLDLKVDVEAEKEIRIESGSKDVKEALFTEDELTETTAFDIITSVAEGQELTLEMLSKFRALCDEHFDMELREQALNLLPKLKRIYTECIEYIDGTFIPPDSNFSRRELFIVLSVFVLAVMFLWAHQRTLAKMCKEDQKGEEDINQTPAQNQIKEIEVDNPSNHAANITINSSNDELEQDLVDLVEERANEDLEFEMNERDSISHNKSMEEKIRERMQGVAESSLEQIVEEAAESELQNIAGIPTGSESLCEDLHENSDDGESQDSLTSSIQSESRDYELLSVNNINANARDTAESAGEDSSGSETTIQETPPPSPARCTRAAGERSKDAPTPLPTSKKKKLKILKKIFRRKKNKLKKERKRDS